MKRIIPSRLKAFELRLIREVTHPGLRPGEHRARYSVRVLSNGREVTRTMPERHDTRPYPWRLWRWHPPYTSLQKRKNRCTTRR